MGFVPLEGKTRQAVRDTHRVSAFLHVQHNPHNVTAHKSSLLRPKLSLWIVVIYPYGETNGYKLPD